MIADSTARLLELDERIARRRAAQEAARLAARPPRRARGLSHRDQVLNFFKNHPTGTYTPDEVDAAVGLPEHAASKRLTELMREGLITHLGDGLGYRLAVK